MKPIIYKIIRKPYFLFIGISVFLMLISTIMVPTSTVKAVEDISAPTLTDFYFTPISIDTSSSAQLITFTFDITDDLSGFYEGSIEVKSPSGQQGVFKKFWTSSRISGDDLDGIYDINLTFPENSEAGTWYVSSVTLWDNANNRRTYFTNQLVSLDFPTYFDVISVSDTTAPTLTDFYFTPISIDTSSSAQLITFTFDITDDLSGFYEGSIEVKSPSGQQGVFKKFWTSSRISGDDLDGIYDINLTFPENSEAGTWYVSSVTLWDNANNRRTYFTNQLVSLDFPTYFDVISVSDTTAPTLTDFYFTPISIDTSSSAQLITFTFDITDDLSGFYEGSIEVKSPSGQQGVFKKFWTSSRISGDDLDGIYNMNLTFPQYSEVGTWYVSSVTLWDNASNRRTYYKTDLSAKQFPNEIEFTLNQPPIADAGGPYTVNEAATLTLDTSGSTDPDDNIVLYEWDLDNDGDFDDATGMTTDVSFEDDGVYPVDVKVTDDYGEFDTDTADVTVLNVAPVIESVTASLDPMQVGTIVETSGTFTDPGVLDTHTAIWNWGDGATSEGLVDGYGVSGSHIFDTAGVYALSLTVVDDDDGEDTEIFQDLIIYDPNAGFVTVGGWIVDAETGQDAHFQFNPKYHKKSTVPQGKANFNLEDLQFKSTAIDWLVVSSSTAQFKGSGTINGTSAPNGDLYQFMIWAGDGTGDGGADTFRIKIWYVENDAEIIVYDNGIDQMIGNGNIVVPGK
jgi:heme-degrading monooxygenase HmoA